MNFSSGKIWPYAIATAVTMVFGFCVATVVVTSKGHIQESNLYMSNYHKVDADANNIIRAKIAFDKKYTLKYITDSLGADAATIKYKVTDKNNKPVENAKFKIVLSRPDSAVNITLKKPKVKNGIYTFKTMKLPKVGVWDIIGRVDVGKLHKFYNLRADTRIKKVFEY